MIFVMNISDIGYGSVIVPGPTAKPHEHGKECEMHYFVSGEGFFVSHGKRNPATRGKLFFSLPHEQHDTVITKHKVSLYFVRFDTGETDAELITALRKRVPPQGLFIGEEYRFLFEELINKVRTGDEALATSATHQLLSFCYALISDRSMTRSDEENTYVRKAVDYLQTALPQPVVLAELAKHVGINKYYLDRIFKRSIGVAPLAYYTKLKIETARYMLKRTTQPVSAVAAALKFCNPYHFSRTFARHTGLSPRAWRERGA